MSAHHSSHGRRANFQDALRSTPRALLARGATREYGKYAVEQAVASGVAVRLLPGVVVARRHLDHPQARIQAVTLWAPAGSMLGGATALALHAGDQPSGKVHLIVPLHARAVAPEWIDVRWLPPLPRWRISRLPTVAAPHAVIDAWHRSAGDDQVNMFYEALWSRVATGREVIDAARDFARIRGRRRLMALAELASQGATSPTEVIAKTRVFSSPEFVDFVWQGRLVLPTGVRIVDMLHPAAKLAVEFDGQAYHASTDQWARDRQRDVELAAAGILTMRFTYRDVKDRPEWCRNQVRAALAWRTSSGVVP